MRPQALTPYRVPCPLDRLPDGPSASIVCSNDRLVNPEWSRRVARDRLNAQIVELPGSSHSPFWSRPEELATVLGALDD
jgi:pimeloyl-ACP methyl ester carboxylesterase